MCSAVTSGIYFATESDCSKNSTEQSMINTNRGNIHPSRGLSLVLPEEKGSQKICLQLFSEEC